MKRKITLLMLTFLMVSFGYAQELATNGNFESGTTGWTGNALNVVTESGNSYNAANVLAAGNPWDVNLSQVLSLTSGKTYTLKFDAWSDQTRTVIAGIGLNEGPWSAATQTVTLGTTSQTYTLTLAAPATSANSRIIFDMGAAVGFVGIDNVSLIEVVATCNDGIQNGDETGVDCGGSCLPCSTSNQPQIAATTPPARPVADVVSVFSDAYSNISVTEWGPNWGSSSSRINDVTIASNPTKVMVVAAGQVFAGIDFAAAAFNATPFTHFHMDYWIADPVPAGQVLDIKLSNHIGGAGETNAISYTVAAQGNQWVSLDIPLANFVAASAPANLDRSAIAQIVITAARADASIPLNVYMDNIYFHKNTLMATGEVVSNKRIVASPNPVISGQNVSFSNDVKEFEVYSVTGQLIKSAKANSLNTQGMKSGVYLVKAVTSKGDKQTIKVIVK